MSKKKFEHICESDPKKINGDNKLCFDHIPLSVFCSVSKGSRPGQIKYGRKNWNFTEKISMNTYLSAIQRHLILLCAGEDYVRDADDYVHHLDAIIASAAILKECIFRENLEDDRVILNEKLINNLAKEICGKLYANLPLKQK